MVPIRPVPRGDRTLVEDWVGVEVCRPLQGDEPPESNGFEAFVEEVRLAGEDGWEAVGELVMTYHPEDQDNSNQRRIRTLLLKRPKH